MKTGNAVNGEVPCGLGEGSGSIEAQNRSEGRLPPNVQDGVVEGHESIWHGTWWEQGEAFTYFHFGEWLKRQIIRQIGVYPGHFAELLGIRPGPITDLIRHQAHGLFSGDAEKLAHEIGMDVAEIKAALDLAWNDENAPYKQYRGSFKKSIFRAPGPRRLPSEDEIGGDESEVGEIASAWRFGDGRNLEDQLCLC